MSRAERRAAAKLARNIQHHRTIQQERRQAQRKTIAFQTTMYLAATVVALHREFGFDRDRCMQALQAIETLMVEAITSDELQQAALDAVGIDITEATEP